jgi:Ca-activated chloride channel family protein
LNEASSEFRFATAVAGYSQLLRSGRYAGQWSYADARALAAGSVGTDRAASSCVWSIWRRP